nr:Chain Z, TIITLE hexapeptide segment from p53 [Homo sapiens]
TIITLE